MSDEEALEADQKLLAVMEQLSEAFREWHVGRLDPCDPLRILARDLDYGMDFVQAFIDGCERRIKAERIEAARQKRREQESA